MEGMQSDKQGVFRSGLRVSLSELRGYVYMALGSNGNDPIKLLLGTENCANTTAGRA